MSKLDIIKEILHENFKPLNQNTLTEKDVDVKGNSFEVNYKIVKQQQIKTELFRYDKSAFPFFKEPSNLKKMCDYILFAEDGNFLYIFVIELKLGNISAKKQLDAAKEFVEYIINSANRIGFTIDSNYKIRKVRICDEIIKKNRPKHHIEFDKNDYCEYPYQSFYLEHLMRY